MSNVTDEQFQSFLEVYRETLASAHHYLGEETRKLIPEWESIGQRLIGYVSTQYGVGFEWAEGPKKTEVIHGSQRIDALFLKMPPRVRRLPSLAIMVTNSAGTFEDLSFSGLRPFELVGDETHIRLVRVTCDALGWERRIRYGELFGSREASKWTEARAVQLANDKILAALVEARQAEQRQVSLEAYLRKFKERLVLLLGAYGDEGKRLLELIRAEVANLGYVPVLVSDIPDLPGYDLEQKAVAIGSISRFVLIEDSFPSGHLVEFTRARDLRWVTAVLRQEGMRSTFVTLGAGITSNTLKEWEYTEESLRQIVAEAVSWCEEESASVSQAITGQYPWGVPLS